MKNGITCIAVYLISLVCVLEPSNEPLKKRLDALFNGHSYAVWSVSIQEKGSKTPFYSVTPNRRLIPASNEKLVVGAAALLRLGPDYTYETHFYTTGKQNGSTLEGNLIAEGSGDPSLGGRFYGNDITYLMRQWASTVKRKGIETIQGHIIGVDDAFDDDPHGLNWHPSDLIEWYAAGVSALSFNDGCVDVLIQGGSKSGQQAKTTLNPDTQYVSLKTNIRSVQTRKSDRGITVKREKDQTGIEITGTIRTRRASTVYVTIPNPTLFFTTVFRETLESEGIDVKGSAMDCDDVELPDKKNWQPLYTHKSLPLLSLLRVCMKNSQNLYAEHFLKTLGFLEYGEGTWKTGAMAVKDILFDHGCRIDGQYLADGSGLSRENRISASTLVKILDIMSQSSHAEDFFDTLPQAGVDGTLKLRMRGTAAQGRVRAKTGTLNGCRALSGTIKARNGKTYLFSMLGNATREASRLNDIMDEACAMIAAQE